jgi:hypothetical protein
MSIDQEFGDCITHSTQQAAGKDIDILAPPELFRIREHRFEQPRHVELCHLLENEQ